MIKIIFIILSSSMIVKSDNFGVRSISSVRQLLKCASTLDYSCMLDYLEASVDNAYKNLMREADASVRAQNGARGRENQESASSILATITSMLTDLPELLRTTLSAALSGDDDGDHEKAEEIDEYSDEDDDYDTDEADDEDSGENEVPVISLPCINGTSCSVSNSTGTRQAKITYNSNKSNKKNVGVSRKKKKKQKLKAFIKLIFVAIVLIVKLIIFLKLLAAKLQIKFFLIAVVNLLINLARFWWDLKKGHDHPQKVIYYEHAQHQHHYDGNDDWHGSGPGDSYWGRAYEKVDEKKTGQELAYAKQVPSGVTYSKVDDKPNFSWNPWAERAL